MSQPATTNDRRGLLTGIGAYGLWGLMPLYFPLLTGAGVWEIGAHRVIWALASCLAILALVPRLARATRLLLRDRRTLGGLAIAAVLLAANWVTFVVAVFTDRVVDAALGYFINPIVTVLLAVLVLRERLRPGQWVAVGIASVGVVVITIGYGTLPWIAVVLAISFALYGMAKNRIGRTVAAIPGMVVETALLAPVAAGYLLVLAAMGTGTFGSATGQTLLSPLWHTVALIGVGLASALPLLLFAVAARRLPLSMVGLLQFIAPTMQFIVGVAIFGEQMPAARWAGFVLVWLSLVVLGIEGARTRRARRRP